MSLTTWGLQTLEPKDLCLALYEHDALVAEYVMPFSWSVRTQKKWSRKKGARCRKQQTHFSSLLPTPCKLFRTFWSSWNSYRPQAMSIEICFADRWHNHKQRKVHILALRSGNWFVSSENGQLQNIIPLSTDLQQASKVTLASRCLRHQFSQMKKPDDRLRKILQLHIPFVFALTWAEIAGPKVSTWGASFFKLALEIRTLLGGLVLIAVAGKKWSLGLVPTRDCRSCGEMVARKLRSSRMMLLQGSTTTMI